MMPQTVYLTGAPASGKSTLTRALRALKPSLEIFEYGQRLTDFINARRESSLSQANIREKSAGIVTPDDVAGLDIELLEFVRERRGQVPVIIDSHPVTKEQYGYRVTPFKLSEFEKLSPTQIWVLFTDPQTAVDRIAKHAMGRPAITEEEARFHTALQASVAVTYGMHIGVPVYFFDASLKPEILAASLAERL